MAHLQPVIDICNELHEIVAPTRPVTSQDCVQFKSFNQLLEQLYSLVLHFRTSISRDLYDPPDVSQLRKAYQSVHKALGVSH